MTRAKAIEAAIDAFSFEPHATISEAIAMAYDAGRIAGLREAARIAKDGGWLGRREIEKQARELAKKARGK